MAVLIVDEGGRPELVQLASAASRQGLLADYIAPFAGARTRRVIGSRRFPSSWRSSFERRLYPDVKLAETRGGAGFFGALMVAVERSKIPISVDLTRRKNQRLDSVAARFLEASSADSVIAPYSASVLTMEASQRAGKRFVLCHPSVHHTVLNRILDDEMREAGEFRSTVVAQAIPRWKIEHADRVTVGADAIWTYGRFHEESFVQAGVPADRLLRAPLGVDPTVFNPIMRRIRAAESDAFSILFVGRIGQLKGIGYLLEAYRAVRRPNWRLVLVGEPQGDILETLARWDLPGVEHIRYLPLAGLASLYRQVDTFVSPSLLEGFGFAPLEAMATGLPSILSEHTFGRDVIEDGKNGFVVPIRDPAAIAEHLVWLAENPERAAEISQLAAETARSLSWEASMNRAIDALGLGFGDEPSPHHA